jgi:hypothetical protein
MFQFSNSELLLTLIRKMDIGLCGICLQSSEGVLSIAIY